MPRVHHIQTAFNAGVMDPRTAARTDLQQYYQGLSLGENIVTRPMGGVRRRPGLRYLGTLPRMIVDIHEGATATAPNGGDPAAAKDSDRLNLLTTTVEVGITVPYVVVHYDLGEPMAVKFADALDLTCSGGNTDGFSIQHSSDGATWTNFGARLERVDQENRDFRREGTVTAQYWRVVKSTGTDLGPVTVSLAGFHLYAETVESKGELFPFEFSIEQRYAVAATDKNLAIIQDDEIVANVPAPWGSQEVGTLDAAQSADTMILVHPDFPPHRLVRGPVSTLWRLEPVPFSHIPQIDFNDGSSPTPVSEIQTLDFTNDSDPFAQTWKQGDTFLLELEGALTRSITFGGYGTADEQTQTAENIRREVQKLPVIGFSGVSVEYTGPEGLFTITFADGSAGELGLLGGIPQSGSASNKVVVTRTQAGSSREEDAWSTLRGWPRSVTFFDGRLYFGGSRSLPQTNFGSEITDLFSFETGEGFDDQAIVQTINSDRLNTIQRIFAGRDLQVFTTGGEASYGREVLTPETAYPRFQSRFGAAAVRPVSIDGATMYVQRTGKVIREFLYSQDEEAYVSPPVSALAPFLINNVTSMAAWQGSGDDDANYVFVVNGDGTVAVFNTLRSQDIAAWCKWTTVGEFKAVTTVVEDIYFLVRREIDGEGQLFIERADESLLLDSAVSGSTAGIFAGPLYFPPVQERVAHLEGLFVTTVGDGYVLEPRAVELGNVAMDEDLLLAEIGLPFAVRCATMPLNSDFGNGQTFLRKKRLVKARLYVHETGSITFNGKRYYDRRFDVDGFDAAPGVTSGMVEFNTTTNWIDGPLVIEFGQDTPGPFELLGMDLQVEVE
jgi:hypothetical protein